ncbi:MAG: Ig-like domain-containing protein, partial [Bacteroidales bacterium]|nr:Ig-like domain-containing protein [Bacteroidales bacterium]
MRRNNILPLIILSGIILWNSCASTGVPNGGPKDVTPPQLVKSVPLRNQVNFNKNRVELFFNELVSLENPSEKVIVSPPQKVSPTVKAYGNKISVLLADSLLPSTTYTIDFTDAIVDYNEKNK